MSSELRVNVLRGSTANGNITIQGEGISNLGGATMQLQQGLCKSWVNQQQDATNNTNDSFNIASDVDNGSGDSTFTVTNAFSSAAFVVVVSTGHSGFQDRFGQVRPQGDGKQLTSSTFRVYAYDISGGTSNNTDGLQVICMGDLA